MANKFLKSSFLILVGGLVSALAFAQTSGSKNTAASIYEKNKAVVFFVKTTGTVARQGSAVAIQSNANSSIVATNCHVVDGENNVSLSNDKLSVRAKVAICDKQKDIALLVVDQKLSSAIIENNPIKPGDTVFALGNPLSLRHAISEGIISRLHLNEQGMELIQSTAAIEPGSSGGGLFNASGNLVGITSSKISGSQGINFSIKIVDFLPYASQAKGEVEYRKEGPVAQGLRPKISYDIKGFAIGAHCSSAVDAVKQLAAEELYPPTGKPAFCSKLWDGEENYSWASFLSINDKIYRKRLFTVSADAEFYIRRVGLQDIWFYDHQVNYPPLEQIKKQIEEKYGKPLFSGKLEEDMRNIKVFSRNEIVYSDVWIYFSGEMSEPIIKEIEDAQTPSVALGAARKAAGDYLFISLSERRVPTGKPLGFTLQMDAGRGSSNVSRKDSKTTPAIRF